MNREDGDADHVAVTQSDMTRATSAASQAAAAQGSAGQRPSPGGSAEMSAEASPQHQRPLANTLPYPVCEADGSAFNDSNVQRHRLRFQKITRRALARGQGNIIKTIVLPPEDRFDLYQDFTANAPATAAALTNQLNHLRRQASNYAPASRQNEDTANQSWHGSDNERTISVSPAAFAELDANP